jgi:hypothetical protein
MNSHSLRSTKPSCRPGTVVVAVMICLTVAMTLTGAWMKLLAVERREIRSQHARAQASWLAESGLQRAASRLRSNHEYRGEVWRLTTADLGGADDAEVLIHIEPVPQRPRRYTIEVQADYPVTSAWRHHCGKTLEIEVADR